MTLCRTHKKSTTTLVCPTATRHPIVTNRGLRALTEEPSPERPSRFAYAADRFCTPSRAPRLRRRVRHGPTAGPCFRGGGLLAARWLCDLAPANRVAATHGSSPRTERRHPPSACSWAIARLRLREQLARARAVGGRPGKMNAGDSLLHRSSALSRLRTAGRVLDWSPRLSETTVSLGVGGGCAPRPFQLVPTIRRSGRRA